MSFPLGYTGILSGLFCGLVFGFALERAGFASACKLTAQMRFRDWAVFNVMFTAILVSAFGLWLLQITGVMPAEEIFIPTTYLWATLLGGVGTAAMATRIELLSGLLPEYAYIIVAGVAAGLTSYRYVSWYHQQRSTKFKNKAARASSSRLADVSREHNNALSDDLLQYQDGIQSQR